MPQDSYDYETRACSPGSEISNWFGHRAEGKSIISMKLPKNWLNSNFFGFATCFVVSLIPACYYFSNSYFVCLGFELHLKTKSGEIYKHPHYKSNRMIHRDDWVVDEEDEAQITSSGITSDHVFVTCSRDYIPRKYGDEIEEASFHLKYRVRRTGRFEEDQSWNSMVKRIGVGLVYGKDSD